MFRRVTIFALVILLLPGMTVLAAPKDSPDAGIKLLEDFQNIFITLADRVKPTVVNIAPQTGALPLVLMKGLGNRRVKERRKLLPALDRV
ncbi:MAG: hypothetical protein MPW14_02460 [Candidatus Manganitrophus sp.]|nr:MAG: hypothetical protein MPW14_02460 [Candidatus Manganitrophus sp.]